MFCLFFLPVTVFDVLLELCCGACIFMNCTKCSLVLLFRCLFSIKAKCEVRLSALLKETTLELRRPTLANEL